MRSTNISYYIEELVLSFVRDVPEFNLDYIELQATELECDEIARFDVVLVESEDEEIVLGEAIIDFDWNLAVEVFA